MQSVEDSQGIQQAADHDTLPEDCYPEQLRPHTNPRYQLVLSQIFQQLQPKRVCLPLVELKG